MPDSQYIPKLMDFRGSQGYISSSPKESDGDYMAAGSENVMYTGSGKTQAFKGVTEREDQDGGIVMQNVAENYASLGQASDGSAFGNAYNVFSALFYIGKGLLRLNGISLLVQASTVLSLLLKRSGSYTDPQSGPWQGGLAKSSAAIIRAVTPPAGMSGKVNGVVSIVIWRIRSTTGAVSVRSDVSNIVGATNQSIAVALPLPDANGQDYWGIGVTKHGEGRTGSHFEYTEIAESTVAESLSRTDVVTNSASLDVTSATGGFTGTHIGWVATFSGGTPSIGSFQSYVTGVPNANTLTLAAMPPTTSTGVSMTLSRGDSGQGRTVVIEWRDGDLVGKPFAPSRDFPPPAGLYSGALEDITFVDGCYADAVDATSGSNPGSAIAPSEKGKPESFSPDNVIPTNSLPTALVRGDGLYWRWSRNDLMVLRYLPGENPLSVEIVWEGIGIEYQHNTCLGEGGRLYLWPSERGAMRMGENGLPDTGFANQVADDLAACTDPAKRVVGWYGLKQTVVYMYEKRAWPFFTNLEIWGAPADLEIEGNVRSCIPDNNKLLISDDLDNLYEYDKGTGSVMKIRTGWKPAAEMLDTVHAVIPSVRADNTNPVSVRVYADGDESTAVQELLTDPSRVGYQVLPAVYPNVIDCQSFAVEVEIESTTAVGDVGLESLTVLGPSQSTLV